jgi:CheY-like chemotaxis protein
MTNWHALIIEDEDDSAEVVGRILTYHKISHVTASSAEDALSILETETPTILIVDLALPKMDGWGFLQAVRSNPATAEIPAVAVTAFHSTRVANEAILAGFDAYFSKPIDATSFVRELERVVSERWA